MANVWAEVDAYVAKHAAQVKRLVELCKAGKLKKPRFIAPCVWALSTRAKENAPSERFSFTSFEAAETFAKLKADDVAAVAEAKRLKKLERSKGRRPVVPPPSTSSQVSHAKQERRSVRALPGASPRTGEGVAAEVPASPPRCLQHAAPSVGRREPCFEFQIEVRNTAAAVRHRRRGLGEGVSPSGRLLRWLL